LASPDLLKNPFVAPRAGYDDGHPGIDLAFWSRPDGQPMAGLPVQAVLAGRVAMVTGVRQPYGNAVLIETPLEGPGAKILRDQIPTPSRLLQPSNSLSCPDYTAFVPGSQSVSLYVLYAHLEKPAELAPGQQVGCAQPIGAVGTTGRSVNPHLHLEFRAGPSGIQFTSMAHYDPAATQDELRNYCLWRISGAFAPFDPIPLIHATTLTGE